MNRIHRTTSALAAGLLLALPAAGAEPEPWVQDSREAARMFGGKLMQELQAGLAVSPLQAIAVCKDRAGEIAAAEAERIGAPIGRTALRVRNPGNAPTDWQRTVLQDFEAARLAGQDLAALEHVAVVDTGDAIERRWMKPIVMAPLCVTCHGATLAPGIAAAVAADYPEDAATGFAPGELRGAFHVVWRTSPAP